MKILLLIITVLATIFDITFSVYSSASAEWYRWARPMRERRFAWEPHPVRTDDGYLLTLFHVTGNAEVGRFIPEHPPVLIMHGVYSDAARWLQN